MSRGRPRAPSAGFRALAAAQDVATPAGTSYETTWPKSDGPGGSGSTTARDIEAAITAVAEIAAEARK